MTFFTMFIIGSRGGPRRTYTYDPDFTGMNQFATLGAYIVAIGFVIMMANLLYSLFRGPKSPGNPWGGSSLEWMTSSPPPLENFEGTPKMRDPYEYSDMEYISEEEGFRVRRSS